MENVRIIELKKDDIVQFQADFKSVKAMQTAIVNRVYAEEFMLKNNLESRSGKPSWL